MLKSLRHHARFYLGLAAAAAVYLLGAALDDPMRTIAAGDTFFAIYLLLAVVAIWRSTPDTIRARARNQDEGIAVVLLLTLAAIALCLFSNFTLVNAERQQGLSQVVRLGLAAANVLLAWFTLHLIYAFHYAHRFYADTDEREAYRRDAGGLDFPGTDEPDLLDFSYYAFVVGMTAQVSDVDARSQAMRRLTLGHSVVSFFFNTVILAFAVNAAVSAAAP